ncbi:MAG: hypothetical protein WED00_00690 [Aquisalimonadaceae bacterium]
MKVTIFLIALAVGGLLERDGYPGFGYGLIAIASIEFLREIWIQPWKKRLGYSNRNILDAIYLTYIRSWLKPESRA